MAPQVFCGKYVVQEEIAKGGMGVVYKALDRDLDRVVAIKLMHAHLSEDSSFVERFLDEARKMACFQHDNIVTIYAVEEHQGTRLLVMEYFQSRNLRMLTRNQPRLPFREIVSITHQLASALAFAHARSIIHRDVTPSNVLVDTRGKTKLIDFGIAKALGEASITIIGKPEYMSPEQARGGTLDGRSDLYSVGIMLYEILTGKTPYAEASKTSILGKIALDQQELALPFPSDVPSLLQGVVRDLLRRQPDERIPDAETLACQLDQILYTLPAPPTIRSHHESDDTAPAPPQKLDSPPPVPDDADDRTAISTSDETETSVSQDVPKPLRHPAQLSPPSNSPPRPVLDETIIGPVPPSTGTKDRASEPVSSTPPPPPPVPSSLRLVSFIGGGILLVAILVGLIWYMTARPDLITSDRPPTPAPPPSDPTIVLLEERLKELEKNKSMLEELVRRTADRLPTERQTPECPALKVLLLETYGKLEGVVRDVNTRRQKLGRNPLPMSPRPTELDLTCEAPTIFPNAQLKSLLEQFKRAYERRDLVTLQKISRFKEGRLRNIEFMFSHYTSFKASIQDLTKTNEGASAQLILESAISGTGAEVSISPLSKKSNLQILRRGEEWDTIVW